MVLGAAAVAGPRCSARLAAKCVVPTAARLPPRDVMGIGGKLTLMDPPHVAVMWLVFQGGGSFCRQTPPKFRDGPGVNWPVV